MGSLVYCVLVHWGLSDRGLVREGMAADLVVFDPATIGAHMPEVVTDLPARAKRLKQTAQGVRATVVNGQVLLRDTRTPAPCQASSFAAASRIETAPARLRPTGRGSQFDGFER